MRAVIRRRTELQAAKSSGEVLVFGSDQQGHHRTEKVTDASEQSDGEGIGWSLLGPHLQGDMKLVGASGVVADGRV